MAQGTGQGLHGLQIRRQGKVARNTQEEGQSKERTSFATNAIQEGWQTLLVL